MTRLVPALSLAALVLTLTSTLAWAQATGSISGTARDQSGGVLPGVTITVTHTGTGATRTTVSNESGAYALPNLPLGPYRLEATLQGFNTFAQTGIVLQVNSNPVVNPVMGVGAVSEQIQVTAATSLVDTRTVGVATVVESQRILELPLNARQVTQLITLSGVAVQTASSPAYGMNTGVRISVAGGNDFGVTYTLDGAPNSNVHDGTGLHLPFPDALQEFRLTTGAQDASSGLRSGATVSAVTRSGTNVLHGSLFEFNRDSRFNSPDFFSQSEGRPEAEPVRRHGGRSDQAGQGVLLRRLPGHHHAADAAQRHRVRADGRDDGGRLHRLHVAGLQRRPRGRAASCAVRGQPDRPCAHQPGGTEHLAPAADTARRVRAGLHRRAQQPERGADSGPARFPGQPGSTRSSAATC